MKKNPKQSSLYRSKAPGRFYDFWKIIWRGVFGCTMRIQSKGLDRIGSEGGVLIAVSHISHLDPIVISAVVKRRISWMSRIEFHQQWLMRNVLYYGGAFKVDRTGAALPAIREALRRLKRSEAVGIFPEGELLRGDHSALRGGRIKRGVCLLAARSGCPVLPVIVLGTDRLGQVGPWMPARRGRLWVAIGQPLYASAADRGRSGRQHFAERLEAEYIRLYQEMKLSHALPEMVPEITAAAFE
jgi:1-acyl-sn-glycerol-3-phosphate acyltransferase